MHIFFDELEIKGTKIPGCGFLKKPDYDNFFLNKKNGKEIDSSTLL